MEMDPQDREDEMGDDSPISHNDEEISDPDGESGRESSDDIRRQTVGNMVADHHEDLIAKLKMQVRDIKDDFENASRHLNFTLPRGAMPESFHLPTPFSFPHPGALMQPMLQPTKPSSGSSNSSDGSNTWSFEEQFKQLYDISDDPKRKEFLDELFSFMHKRGTPINRLPIMAKSVLDLYQLYNLVVQRGGLVEVINKKLWQEIIKGLQLPSSITSAAFTLRTQYMKYLYPFEVEQHHLSTEADLQAAIDGNRREGRRSNYAQYDTVQRSPSLTQQMTPLSLISQQQQIARMNSVMSGGLALHNGSHHPTHTHQPLSQQVNGGALAAFAHGDMEARMLEYVKMFKDLRVPNATSPRQENLSPPGAAPSPFNQLELSRTLWNVYNNNQPQKEALNLSESTIQSPIKREPEQRESPPPSKKMFKAEEERKPIMSPATHIKISNRGDARNGDSSLFVSMEINGITYEGVLCALTTPSNGRSSLSP